MSRDPKNSRQSVTEKETILTNAYLDSLLILGLQAAEVCPAVGVGAQETLLRLRRRLAFACGPQDLDDAHDVVHATVRDFSQQAKELLDRRASEYGDLYALASRSADTAAARDRSHLEILRDIARTTQRAATAGDPNEARRLCQDAALALTRISESFQDDSNISQLHLRRELEAFEQRRRIASEAYTVDRLTGLYTRTEVERRMRDALALGKQFCILKLGLHEFSGLADRYGVQIGSLLRKSAADKLSEQVRPRDILAQWDANTFLLLFFNCSLAVAESRSREIADWLSGDYRLYPGDQIVHADVELTAAATEIQPGEDPEAFIGRAEALSPVLMMVAR